jgi:hypothetical protein
MTAALRLEATSYMTIQRRSSERGAGEPSSWLQLQDEEVY